MNFLTRLRSRRGELHSPSQHNGAYAIRPYVCAAIALLGGAAMAEELVPIQTAIPKPWSGSFIYNLERIMPPNMEPSRDGKPYPPILVPKGCDQLLSKGCTVTSSDPNPIEGKLSFVTDGRKEENSDGTIRLVLNADLQWIQIDLDAQKEIYAVWIWHSFDTPTEKNPPRIYNDVIVQIADDPDFSEGVETIFNNDHDNSAKLGEGKDFAYFETNHGRPIPANGVKGRYVRCYSRGITAKKNAPNVYVQVEVFGRK